MNEHFDWTSLYWNDIPYIVFDTETTGVGRNDRVCEVTVALCRNGEIEEAVSSLVNPGCSINPEAAAIHGITDDDVINAPELYSLSGKIIALLERGAPWVAHNMSFDTRFLDRGIPKSMWPHGIPTLCTMNYAKHKHPILSRYSRHKLIDVAVTLDISVASEQQTHRSMDDVVLLARIVPKLVGNETVHSTMTKYSHEW